MLKFLLDKDFAKPSYLCIHIAENFCGINVRQCSKKVAISYVHVYAIINMGQKISVIKFSPMRAGGEIGENFSWQNGIIVNSRRKA